MRILLSRTDSIGDVILTLPMTGEIKKHFPNATIDFLGKTYTKDIIRCCQNINEILDWSELSRLPEKEKIMELSRRKYDAVIHVFPAKELAHLMKKAGIKKRIGTSGRLYHLSTCNKLIRFSRKRSDLHEAQLNMKLLEGIGIKEVPAFETMGQLGRFKAPLLVNEKWSELLRKDKFNVILHPKSQGSAVEWGVENFASLIDSLPEEKYQIFLTGTEGDKKAIGNSLSFDKENVIDLMGKMTLNELVSFIDAADGLVAASTGPLHIAGILNKVAIGLFSPKRPIHPGRWAPIGTKSSTIVFDEKCTLCSDAKDCFCITKIPANAVIQRLNSYLT